MITDHPRHSDDGHDPSDPAGRRRRRTQTLVAYALEAVLVAVLIAAAATLLGISGVNVNNNGAIYLLQADKLMELQNPGLTFADRSARGPVFPLLLAAAMFVGGKTVAAAMFAVRLVFVANLVVVYALQRMLFGRAVAIATVVLVATSNGLNVIAGSLDTDGVLPTFVSGFLLTYWVAYKRASVIWGACAGVVLALTVLTKESAVGFLIVPLTAFAVRDRTWERLRKVTLPVYVAAVLPVLAWTAAIVVAYGTVSAAFGIMHPSLQEEIAVVAGAPGPVAYWVSLFTVGLPRALVSYFRAHVTQASPLAPAFVVAWMTVLIYAVRRRQAPELVIAAAGIAFLPVILRLGDYPSARVGQSSVTFLLSYMAVGGALGLLASSLAARGHDVWRRAAAAIIVLAGVAGAGYQLTHAAGVLPPTEIVWREGAGTTFPLSVLHRSAPFKVIGRFTEDQESAARWLVANGATDATIAGDGYTQEAIDFFLTTRKPVEVFHPLVTVSVSNLETFDAQTLGGPIVFAMTYGRFQVAGDGRVMLLASQEFIRSTLQKTTIDYVVISGRGQWAAVYLEKVPWARLVYRVGSVSVFEIDRRGEMPLLSWPEVCVNEAFAEHMDWLTKSSPNDAIRLSEALEAASLHLDDARRTSCRIPRGSTP